MKYIKDRFYNSRKTSPSFGTPAQGLFTREERTASFLRVVSAKVQQVFQTTKYSEKFFFESPIGIRKPIGRSEATEGRNPPKLPAVHLSRNRIRHLWPVGSPSSLGYPFLLSCECKGTTTFRIHQISGEVFFREHRSCVLHLLYRSAQIAETPYIYSAISARTCDLSKRGHQATL